MATCQICKYAGIPKDESPCSECKGFSKYEYEKQQTTADRIRAMSDEELAKMFAAYEYRIAKAALEQFGIDITTKPYDFEAAEKDMLSQLQQPAEEG